MSKEPLTDTRSRMRKLFTWWVFPFTLAMAIYAAVLIFTVSLPIYIIYLIVYGIDMICQISAALFIFKYQIWTLIGNAALAILSTIVMLYRVVHDRRVVLSFGLFHLFVLLYTCYLALLFACYSKKTFCRLKNIKDEESKLDRGSPDDANLSMGRNYNPNTLKHQDSQSHLDYYFMQPMTYKDSIWSLVSDEKSPAKDSNNK